MSTNEPMTQERLDAIRARLSDVGAPWEFAPTPNGDGGEVIRVGEQGGPIAWGIDIDAAGLIAHAPEDLADLLAEVERLRAQRTVTEDMMERAARTFYEYPMMKLDASLRTNWDRLTTISPDVADNHRTHAAAALTAALTPDESS